MRVTEAEHAILYRQRHGKLPATTESTVEKRHKFNAHRVVIDGHTFPSKLEAQHYVDLLWQYKAGLITEPLLQVRFSLGTHYGRERFYVADFTYTILKTGQFVVVDTKGMRTRTYLQKKEVFEKLYQIPICEIVSRRRK